MGLIKYFAFGAASFTLGYLTCNALKDERYTIRRSNSTPYLVDKITKNSAVINENLQTGTIEERILSIIKEKDLNTTLSSMERSLKEAD